ncbi:MAG TPA: TrkA family potassium uptake protein [Deltaproteobacteria bacterium]|nr:TrkA family potassium uptake protein [Deltaproteobacteria bacterium]HPR54125.1 TrkA family potassium uptake protein [Deltaproteobacteria bacterium]HXK47073.1 TrkA family potassium uptake protein [Deltaproteobacteria bacterium]
MKKKYVVIGLGNFGYWVARTLFEAHQETIVIDMNKEIVQRVNKFTSMAVIADVTNKETLTGLGLSDCDAAIISLGDHPAASTLATLYLHEMGVKQILVKAIDENHAKILRKVGATDIIFPEKDMGVKVAKTLVSPNILDYLEMTEDYEISQIGPPAGFIGKTLMELELPSRYGLQIIAVRELIPENFIPAPRADFVIKDSDILYILGRKKDIDKIRAM